MKPLVIAIHAVPSSLRSEITGWVPDAKGGFALKVRLNAPPEDGKANKELLSYLARQWGVPKTALEVISGAASRHKRIRVSEPPHASAISALLPPIPPPAVTP